jgi:cytochrome P450
MPRIKAPSKSKCLRPKATAELPLFEPIDFSKQCIWVVKGVDEGHAILRSRNFSLDIYEKVEADEALTHQFMMAPSLEHLRYRRAIAKVFCKAFVSRMRTEILDPIADEVAYTALRQANTRGSVIFFKDCVWHYQTAAIYRLAGLDRESGDEIVAGFRLLQSAADGSRQPDASATQRYVQARAAELLTQPRHQGIALLPDILALPEVRRLDD